MGIIVRISGPVVIAEDVENAKMFDVVRVGKLKLVGEIIKIVGNRSTIQVYEDTSGIRPGEDVQNTGRPLSVELGPGLLKSIYDGIQRPLDVIREKSGNFIGRGITAPSLDPNKTWDFKPIVKKGDEVVPGKIIGTVQETGIIEHKIMVPPNVSGKITKISEGKMTINDTVAEITSGKDKFEIKMKQEWPVRIARRVLRKLPPEIPLVTGQRVIDTFFPVAKGGTVAVPGPFGSGKCVSGDTPVIMQDGSIRKIEEIFRNYDGGIIPGNEKIIDIPEGVDLFSFKDSRVIKSHSSIIYHGKSNSMISIETRSGRRVRITPVHKLFSVRSDSNISEIMAKDLKEGDKILSVRKIAIDAEDQTINFSPTDGGHAIPRRMNSDLAIFLAIFFRSGRINGNKLSLKSHPGERFLSNLVDHLFGPTVIIKEPTEDEIFIYGPAILNFVRSISLDQEGRKIIPESIMTSSDASVSSFVNTILKTSSDGEVNFENSESLDQFSYLLARLGLFHTLSYGNDSFSLHVENNLAESISVNSSSGLLSSQILSEEPGAITEESSVFADEIVKISVENGEFDVYDFSLPDHNFNFIGGHGGIVLHNTVVQHQLSKWADSDIVVYVGCGERGNEMTEILSTFPELVDPRSGKPLMERTVLIANTSNMPVAAREASIYTGITIAEYYRDMGYDVALMADSTSRWAEALREISGRLEEMPGEEGYPAYLGRRLAEFYERSGNSIVLSDDSRHGSVTIVGAVSPPGGDISEPVSQNTLRVTRAFWALDASLASRRHFPSINWLNSYSLYHKDLTTWFDKNVSEDFTKQFNSAMELLQKEAELQEVAQLVGYDSLPDREKNTLDIARMIREDFLQQSAFDEVDQYCSLKKQYLMLKSILSLGDAQSRTIESGVPIASLQEAPVRSMISRMKEVRDSEIDSYYENIQGEIKKEIDSLVEAK
jgi:V/A-type H+-transporting ATPase subunit A